MASYHAIITGDITFMKWWLMDAKRQLRESGRCGKALMYNVMGVCVCLWFCHLFPTFPLDQGGDRKPAFIFRLWLIGQVQGQISHLISPINCHRCDPAVTFHPRHAKPIQSAWVWSQLIFTVADTKCLFLFSVFCNIKHISFWKCNIKQSFGCNFKDAHCRPSKTFERDIFF